MTQTLERNKADQESRPHQGGGTDLVAEDGCDDDQLEGSNPEVVKEDNDRVKSAEYSLFMISKGEQMLGSPPIDII